MNDPKPSSLLIVDDDADACFVLTGLLKLLVPRMAVWSASDGAMGLSLAIVHRPEAVVLDLEMPVVDGLSAARAMRIELADEPPILACMSGNATLLAMPSTAQAFDLCMLKPVTAASLLARLGTLCDARRRAARRSAH